MPCQQSTIIVYAEWSKIKSCTKRINYNQLLKECNIFTYGRRAAQSNSMISALFAQLYKKCPGSDKNSQSAKCSQTIELVQTLSNRAKRQISKKIKVRPHIGHLKKIFVTKGFILNQSISQMYLLRTWRECGSCSLPISIIHTLINSRRGLVTKSLAHDTIVPTATSNTYFLSSTFTNVLSLF